MAEFHDLAEIGLNQDGEAWGNLGYWHAGANYSQACRALAMLLGDAAELNSSHKVFDAGFGCGDQLLLWLQHYQVKSLSGVNLSKSQTTLAKRRVEEAGFDATALQTASVASSSVWQASCQQSIDRIIALDCAYHFTKRTEFFHRSFRALSSGGKVALTDMVFAGDMGKVKKNLLKLMLLASRIPASNAVSEILYRSQLAAAGFSQVITRDISEEVLVGFYKAQQQLGKENAHWQKMKYRVTAKFLNWAYSRNLIRYILVTAEKSP